MRVSGQVVELPGRGGGVRRLGGAAAFPWGGIGFEGDIMELKVGGEGMEELLGVGGHFGFIRVDAVDVELKLEHEGLLVERTSFFSHCRDHATALTAVDGERIESKDGHHSAHLLGCLGGTEGDFCWRGEGLAEERGLDLRRRELHDEASRGIVWFDFDRGRRGGGRGGRATVELGGPLGVIGVEGPFRIVEVGVSLGEELGHVEWGGTSIGLYLCATKRQRNRGSEPQKKNVQ